MSLLRSKTHPFHVVNPTYTPLIASVALWGLLFFAVILINPEVNILTSSQSFKIVGLFTFVFALALTFFLWGSEISAEAVEGHHTYDVRRGLRYGFILFIASEVMFFVSVFWAFLHLASIPSIHMGGIWPPLGIHTLDPRGIPLLNTVVLLSSGMFTVWAHRALLAGHKKDAMVSILGAVLLGLYFSWLQFLEYSLTDFSINDSAYGSVFFFATGFHGIHVIVGTILLWISYCRLANDLVSRERHLGFELAAWYWHFVDVVWIFLYVLLYWWGSTRA